jgi:hypothetical protein
MVHSFEIIPAKRYHCGQMARIMRDAHKEEYLRMGFNIHRRLCDCFDMSLYCKAWIIDGKLAALGGIEGPIISDIGYVWLVMTQEATKYPIAMIKTIKKYLAEIMLVKKELAITVMETDQAALRLAVYLGFHVDHRELPRNGRDRKISMMFLLGKKTPRLHGYLIPMGYHKEEPECALEH